MNEPDHIQAVERSTTPKIDAEFERFSDGFGYKPEERDVFKLVFHAGYVAAFTNTCEACNGESPTFTLDQLKKECIASLDKIAPR